jgi:hypothetical protein
MKTIAILQPSYLPWCGYFEQMAHADLFVHFDDVPFTRLDWRNRNRVLHNGQPYWLSVPTVKQPLGTPISNMTIDYSRDWTKKHLKTIESAYGYSPHFALLADAVFPPLESKPTLLIDLNLELARTLAAALGVSTPCVRSSAYELDFDGKSDRVLKLCLQLEADRLYDGQAARNFIDVDAFGTQGIDVRFQDYQHPVYAQGAERTFTSHLSVIDLIANTGSEAGALMRSGGIAGKAP